MDTAISTPSAPEASPSSDRDQAAHRWRWCLIALAIVLCGLLVRVSTFKAPLLDHHAWRQAHTATIARNFYREDLNLLHPQVDERGAGEVGYIATGVELLAFGVALISVAAGEFYFEIGRLLSSLLYVVGAWFLFAYVKERYGREHALVAVFVQAFCFALLLYMDRAFMNEGLLVTLTLVAMWAAQRRLRPGGGRYLVFLVLASSAVALIKLPFLILWAPILGLYVERHGWRTARRPDLYVVAAVNLALAGSWYRYAASLGEQTGLTFGLTDKLFAWELALSPSFYRVVLHRLTFDLFGPVAMLMFIAGLAWTVRERRWAEPLAVAGFGAYVLIVARGVLVHDYYLIPVVPTALVLVAVGTMTVGQRIAASARGKVLSDRAVVVSALLTLMMLGAYVRSVSFESWYEVPFDRLSVCQVLREATEPQERVIFLMHNNPDMLFCADRKGWLLPRHQITGPALRDAMNAGAVAVVSPLQEFTEPVQTLLNRRTREKLEVQGWAVHLLRLGELR